MEVQMKLNRKESDTNNEEHSFYRKILACPSCNKPIYYKSKEGFYICYYCKKKTKEPKEREVIRDQNRTKKRILTEDDVITRKELLFRIRNISGEKTIMYKALVSFLYLTAARIKEVVGIKEKDKEGRTKIIVPPVKKSQIMFKEVRGKKYMVIIKLPVFKRKLESGKIPKRNVPIFIDNDEPFVEYIKRYIKTKEENDYLFDISPQRAWQISKKIIIDDVTDSKAFNHYWRHLRLTHLAEDYGFQDLDLQQFVGWANTLMASKYTHLNWQTLALKMSAIKIDKGE